MTEPRTGPTAARAGMTLREAVRWASNTLRQARTLDATSPEEAIDHARRLLHHVTGLEALGVVREPDRALTAVEADALNVAIARRLNHEPVTRIIGKRAFYGRDFLVTPAVLDPRSDTEVLIDTALELVRAGWPQGKDLRILDIGTGSGAILLTLLAELPAARGTGIDPSVAALAVARENATRLGVANRCTWIEGRDLAGQTQRFDLVISNPPYIPTATIAGLAPDVRNFDPHLALDGGPDGLDVYRAIALGLARAAPPTWVVLEVGDNQAADVRRVMLSALTDGCWTVAAERKDLAGRPRCVALLHQA